MIASRRTDVLFCHGLETSQGTWVAFGVSSAVADVRRLDLRTGTLTDAIFQVRAKPTEDVTITALTEGPGAWGGKSRPFSASRGSEEHLLDALRHVTAVDDRDPLVDVYHVEPDRRRPTVERPGTYLLREGEATRVGPAVSRAVLTATHVILADDCAGTPCIRGIVRR